jgi:two-component system, LuxR family, response regulator FixJ
MDALVYLIDDEFSVRDSLTLVLESAGLRVKSFESAEDFLKNYNNEYPSCLILDVRMPCMSGLELQEELLKRNISIPIIFISGHAGISQSAKAFRAGAVDFLKNRLITKCYWPVLQKLYKKILNTGGVLKFILN